jgi:sulfur-oxidizing protein SoxY
LARRKALKTGGSLGLLGLFAAIGLIQPGTARAARNIRSFEAKTMDDALDALGAALAENSTDIQVTAPETAENGAFVPVTITSSLPRIEQISILVDKNPTMLVANFILPESTEGLITTRIRMAQTANVIVLVKADGKFYRTSREVKVVLGGCN